MKINFSKIKACINKFIKAYNFLFFLISTTIWLYLTIINLATQPFEFGLLWSAFNSMYGQLSFKVSCIFLIIFNGLQSIRSYIFKYYDLMETHENLSTLHKLTKGKKASK
jgi:hypothetical protein